MASSEKKRIKGKKLISKKTKIKFIKRTTENYNVLNKLES